MALIKCPECGREISDRAAFCVGCGISKEDIQDILADQKIKQNEINNVQELSVMETNGDYKTDTILDKMTIENEIVKYPTISILCQNDKTNYAEKNDDKKSKCRTEVDEINLDETEESGCNDELELKTACRKGDIIKFGNYMGEPIEWQVLEVQNNIALIVSKHILDFMPYHDGWPGTSWEECSLRRYLNGGFIDRAFGDKGKSLIHQVEIKNNYNNEIDITRNDNIGDRVFCLSEDEVMTYFSDRDSRRAKVTNYAKKKVKRSKRKYYMDVKSNTGDYWLRTLKGDNMCAMRVTTYGDLLDGRSVGLQHGIRPALYLNLEGLVTIGQKMFDR